MLDADPGVLIGVDIRIELLMISGTRGSTERMIPSTLVLR